MGNVKRVYVEKKAPFAVKAKELQEEIGNYLDIKSVTGVRIFIRYDVENLWILSLNRHFPVCSQSRR